MGKKSSKTTSSTVYGNTTTTNPYVTANTNNSGTTAAFNSGTAFDTINNFVNRNISTLLDEYLNPTLNSVSNQAKLNAFMDNLSSNTAKTLENDIINPLSRRNMLRSSQATNMYNNVMQNNSSQVAKYIQELLANSQQNTAGLISNLIMLYLNGYNVLSDTQKQSLSTSMGNASRTNAADGSSGIDMNSIYQIAQMAAKAAAGGVI